MQRHHLKSLHYSQSMNVDLHLERACVQKINHNQPFTSKLRLAEKSMKFTTQLELVRLSRNNDIQHSPPKVDLQKTLLIDYPPEKLFH